MSRFWKRLLLLCAVALPAVLFVHGCDGGGGIFGIDEPTEIRIGQQAAADIERQYTVINDPVQTPRVQRIGRNIAAVSRRPNLPWSFRILNMTEINAFALPGGPVYVTRGLLETGLPDAELAGVLAHEVAHIDERHSVQAIQRSMTAQLLADLVLGGSSAAVQTAANLAIQLAIELPHSRSAEYEADALGIRLAYNAGYPAGGLVAFLDRLQRIAGPTRTPEFLRTHPLTEDRIARAQQVTAQVAGQPRPVPVMLSEADLKVLKQLEAAEAKEAAATAE